MEETVLELEVKYLKNDLNELTHRVDDMCKSLENIEHSFSRVQHVITGAALLYIAQTIGLVEFLKLTF